jgi:hypothetical protein
MAKWGSENWGRDPWGGFDVQPSPVPIGGDGHLPFVMNIAQTVTFSPTENWQIEMSPNYQFDLTNKTQWIWHFCGDCTNLDAGKTVTIKVHKMVAPGGNFATDPVVATASVVASGLFHVKSSVGLIPAGPWNYYVSYLTDDVTGPQLPQFRDFIVVTEVF